MASNKWLARLSAWVRQWLMWGNQNFPMKHFVPSSLRNMPYKSFFHCVPEPGPTPTLSFMCDRVLGCLAPLASSSPGTERVDAKRRGAVTPRHTCKVRWARDKRDSVTSRGKGRLSIPTVGSQLLPSHFKEAAKITLLPAVATSHIRGLPMSLLALHVSKQTPHFSEYNIKRGIYQM